MSIKKYEVKTYISSELYEQIREEAMLRRLPITQVLRHCLTEYYALRKELAHAIQAPGELGETHNSPFIHALFARTEERIEAAMKKLENRLIHTEKELCLLLTMIDQSYFHFMQYLPNPSTELMPSALATAKARYKH